MPKYNTPILGLALLVFGITPARDVLAQRGGKGPAAQPRAAVEGDVYLVMRSGDIRRIAASRVYLLARTDAVRTVGPSCAAARAMADSADALRRASEERVISALEVTARPVPTGIAAHYRFEEIAPGSYALYSDIPLAYFWFVTLDLPPGNHRRDLDNNNVAVVRSEKTHEIAQAVCAFVAGQD